MGYSFIFWDDETDSTVKASDSETAVKAFAPQNTTKLWTLHPDTHTNLVKPGILTKLSIRCDYRRGFSFQKEWKASRSDLKNFFTEIEGTDDDKVKWTTYFICATAQKNYVYLFQALIGVFA